MAQNSKIEWTDHTGNLWHGCTKVHAGCDHCYAETLSHRWGRDIWGNDKPRMEIKSVWNDFAKYQKLAKEAGEIHRVFVGSMMDIFEKPMPLINCKGEPAIDASDGSPICTDVLRDRFFNEVVPACPNLLFLLLTKRPSNINKYIPESWKDNPPANVMFGTSPVDQKTADTLIPQLLQVNGKRFLSIEPLIGSLDLKLSDRVRTNDTMQLHECTKAVGDLINWIIVGGESGNSKETRPMHPNWVRSLRDQCETAEIPFFFKQWGEFTEGAKSSIPISKWLIVGNDGSVFSDDDVIPHGLNATLMSKVGKKEAGRLLDGVLHNELPA